MTLMGNTPATRQSLLIRLRDVGDDDAWSQFVDLYAPLIHGFCRKQGLQDADAADITQEVLRKIVRASATWEYDPRRGSFRGWLFTIVRNRLRDFRAAQRSTAEPALLDHQPDRSVGLEELWEREYRHNLFALVANEIRPDFQPSTWEAFRRTAVEGQPPAQVGQQLGLSLAAVYLAKSRVMARFKERVREFEDV